MNWFHEIEPIKPTNVVKPQKSLVERLQQIEQSMLEDIPLEQLALVRTLINDVQNSSYLGSLVVRPTDVKHNPPTAECGHAACKWVGPMRDAKYNGIFGPFCPKCGKLSLNLDK